MRDPLVAPAKGRAETTSDLAWQMLGYMAVVLVLGAVAMVVLKRILPRVGRGTTKRLGVLETTYLGPRRSVHLLRVGKRTLLLGAGREGVQMLADVTDAVEPHDEAPPSKP
jgi:flagellar biogenesis protein FliO